MPSCAACHAASVPARPPPMTIRRSILRVSPEVGGGALREAAAFAELRSACYIGRGSRRAALGVLHRSWFSPSCARRATSVVVLAELRSACYIGRGSRRAALGVLHRSWFSPRCARRATSVVVLAALRSACYIGRGSRRAALGVLHRSWFSPSCARHATTSPSFARMLRVESGDRGGRP